MSDFRKQVSFGLVGRVLTAGTGLIGTIMVARLTDPAVYGLFFFLYGVADVMSNPFGGWVAGCRKRITESGSSESEIMGAFLIGMVILTVIGTSLLWFLGFLRPIGQVGSQWLLVGLLFVGLNLTQQTGMILNARLNFGYQSWIDLLKTVLKYLGQLGLVYLGFQTDGLVYGATLSLVLVSPVTFWLIGVRPSIPGRQTLESIWRFAKPKFPQSLMNTMLGRIDTLILGFLATDALVGHYNIALRVTAPAVFLMAIISGGTFGDVSRKNSQGDEIVGRIRQSLSYTSVMAIPIFFGSLVMGKQIIVTAYSSKYAPAATFLIIVALYRTIRTQETVLGSVINGMDMPWTSLWLNVAEFVTNIVLSVGLFFVLGPVGVVVGSVIAQSILYLGSLWIVRREVDGAPLAPQPLLIQILSGVLMSSVLFGLYQVRSPGSWIDVILYVTIGGMVYVGGLLVLSDGHRQTALNVVGDYIGD